MEDDRIRERGPGEGAERMAWDVCHARVADTGISADCRRSPPVLAPRPRVIQHAGGTGSSRRVARNAARSRSARSRKPFSDLQPLRWETSASFQSPRSLARLTLTAPTRRSAKPILTGRFLGLKANGRTHGPPRCDESTTPSIAIYRNHLGEASGTGRRNHGLQSIV